MSQLTADAKKLTKRSSNGTIKVAGYNPFLGFYAGNTPDLSTYAPLFGAKYVDGSGHSSLSKDPAWSRLLKWQKNLVDWYGYKNLQKFDAGAAAEHPELDYGTAPAPVDDSKPNLYGAGYVNGTIIGIPKGVKHKDQAWALLKYLTFNAHPLAQFSNAIRNVPTTKESLNSPEIKPDAHFKTFLTIFKNPNTPEHIAGLKAGSRLTFESVDSYPGGVWRGRFALPTRTYGDGKVYGYRGTFAAEFCQVSS
jgi:multiple sugar transport system substrate-binding protein